ncbi:MAG: ABC transporter permease [Actinomycetota bacterium]|nr:ABC transporter permease [Actinomycetota bacterium]
MATPLAFRVFEAEMRVYRRTWLGSVFSGFLSPILYLVAMGVGLGSLVDANIPEGLDGVSYLTFLAPGLLVASAMQAGAAEGSWKVMGGVRFFGTWKGRVATPVSISALALGHMYWSAARVLMVSVSFAIVITLFGVTSPLQSLGTLIPAMLVGTAMVAVTTAYTVRLKEFTGIPAYLRFVVIPMFLLSGVFFPITQLPGWTQPIAYATPVYHGVEMARSIAFGATPSIDWWVSVIYLTVWIVVGTALVIRPLRKLMTP